MENELEELYKELNEVKACDLNYLPKYGYSSKYDYTPDEFEDERMFLCVSQGMPRYC